MSASASFRGVFVSDSETATDLLYFDAIARTVVGYIEGSGEMPISIGVHGDWGAGKSSVLKMTEQLTAGRRGMFCLWFNGWLFEGYEDAKAALIEHIVLELRDRRGGAKKVADAAAEVLKRLDYLKIAKLAVRYGGTLVTGIPHPGVISDAIGAVKAAADMVAGNLDAEKISKALDTGLGLMKEGKEGKKVPEEMKEFRKAFAKLLEAAEISRLVVLIDDLDRCLPETAIATLEAIRLFLFIERTAFVIGADEQMIEYSVKRHFPDFQRSGLPDAYARNYLEKLIQVPFRIPALGAVETQTYVFLVMAEAILVAPEHHELFGKLAAAARGNIVRPWDARALEARDIDAVVAGSTAELLKEALSLSAQVYRVLHDGTKGNPRLIKRFLNAVLIRQAIAQERGLAEDIKLPQLAKVMLAERYHATFFDQLVGSFAWEARPDRSELLAALEGAAEGKDASAKLGPEQKKLLEEWMLDERVITWSRIQPRLSAGDLRPYIFVARDRQRSIFGYAMGARLSALVEKLAEGEYAAAGAAAEVKALDVKEAYEVAQGLKSALLAAGEFKKEPSAFAGLQFLAGHKPEVRLVVLNCLANLPAAELGGWAWPALKDFLGDPALKADAEVLQRRWYQEGSKNLKRAMKAITG